MFGIEKGSVQAFGCTAAAAKARHRLHELADVARGAAYEMPSRYTRAVSLAKASPSPSLQALASRAERVQHSDLRDRFPLRSSIIGTRPMAGIVTAIHVFEDVSRRSPTR
jgi:hypothetical protein